MRVQFPSSTLGGEYPMAMPKKWMEVAGDLLDLASDTFSNHGCNDWVWPQDWTPEERRELVEAVVSENVGRPPD